MVDYAKALEVSKKPYHTLAQAFADVTGVGIDTRFLQKYINEYGPQTVLQAIMTMRGKTVAKPDLYMVGILRNMATKQAEVITKPVVQLNTEFLPNKAKLGNPFNAVTA